MAEGLVTLSTEDWSLRALTARDGRRLRVEGYRDGRCPTEICGAVCCRVMDQWGRAGTCCEALDRESLSCRPHARGGPACKPLSCWLWPLGPADIDKVNELAQRFGHAGRCQLRIVEVNDGDGRER